MLRLAIAALVAWSGTTAHAQFTDLQPGRNFGAVTADLGANRSEDVGLGDVDNDGDLDIVIANGGDFGNEPNRIFINNGGLQGGTEGTFTEETATRFAGVPNDTSRDIDLVDLDGDGDLDVHVANRGNSASGQPSRFYVNQGGLQGGALGFFVEDTDARWGSLASVPVGQQVFGGDAGPWESWSCECEFADLDNDGDQDLFHGTYGPNMNGSLPTRIFLNDGTGVFDELFPWVSPGADIQLHSLDMELVDLDGDFDIDVVNASRDSQARVYINNLYQPLPIATALFTDTTAVSLIATGSESSGNNNYGSEVGDLDGDGDFDVWMTNYTGFADKVLVNQGTDANGIVEFKESDGPGPDLIQGEPNVDVWEAGVLDFDNDGDLDVMVPNWANGPSFVFANATAQGHPGQLHNTTGQSGSAYPQDETPALDNDGRPLDVDVGDLDGDGDVDVVFSHDSNQDNERWENLLGVPDSHAPVIADEHVALGLAPAAGGGLVVNVSVRDNAPADLIRFYDVALVSQPGDVSTPMTAQGAQLFRGELPPGVTSFVVQATDLAGNVGLSDVQGVDGAFTDLGCADPGVAGEPVFTGLGTLEAGTAGTLLLADAAPSALAVLFLGPGPGGAGAPFKGGTLKAVPVLASISVVTDGAGGVVLPFVTPAGLSGASVVAQWAVADAAASAGASLSNALQLDLP